VTRLRPAQSNIWPKTQRRRRVKTHGYDLIGRMCRHMSPPELVQNSSHTLFEIKCSKVNALHVSVTQDTANHGHGQSDAVCFDLLVIMLSIYQFWFSVGCEATYFDRVEM
jgi:hypothetical protein